MIMYKVDLFEKQVTTIFLLNNRWKIKDNKNKTKARLVACDFKEDISNLRKYSSIWSRECLHLVFLTAALIS